MPAYLGYLVMVVGRREREWASSIRSIVPAMDTPELLRFLDWLARGAAPPPDDLKVRVLGELVAWYCNPRDAFGLHQRIAGVARHALIDAVRARDKRTLYQMSWWLSRAGLDDSDQFLAAVGLEHCDPPLAHDFLQGGFAGRPAEAVQAGLVSARQVLWSLSQWAEPVERPGAANIGRRLRSSRSHVRSAHTISAQQGREA
jgi:hypothetical protein